jgi:acid phosphatase type 7
MPTFTPTRTPTAVPPTATSTRTPTATVTPTSPAAPAAPSGLTATGVSRNRIDLGWTDNSNNETGFEVQRSKDAATWTLLASPGANSVAYSDTGLTPNKTFYYRVRAVNLSGSSAWSNTASARTPKK